jgi:hypothetical protein
MVTRCNLQNLCLTFINCMAAWSCSSDPARSQADVPGQVLVAEHIRVSGTIAVTEDYAEVTLDLYNEAAKEITLAFGGCPIAATHSSLPLHAKSSRVFENRACPGSESVLVLEPGERESLQWRLRRYRTLPRAENDSWIAIMKFSELPEVAVSLQLRN